MRIYAYGARDPIHNVDKIHEQLRLSHAYQCALVAIERERRAAVDKLYRETCPNEYECYETARAVTSELIPKMKATRARSGDMLEPDAEMAAEATAIADTIKAELLAAREQEKVAYQAWRDVKKAATPVLRPRLREFDAEARAANKRAYGLARTVGIAWGTLLKIAESVERAAKAAAMEGTLPHFPRFDGGGSIVVQLQGAWLKPGQVPPGTDKGSLKSRLVVKWGGKLCSVVAYEGTLWTVDVDTGERVSNTEMVVEGAEAQLWYEPREADLVDDTRFRFTDPPVIPRTVTKRDGRVVELPRPTPGSRRSERKRVRSCVANLRIGSDGREPVWASWPVKMERPIPAGAPIKWVTAHARRVGPNLIWQLLITVEDAAFLPATRAAGETLAVNLGWRNVPADGGLRVAYAVGTDGYEEEIRVPPRYISSVGRTDGLRSDRDKLFETAKGALKEWLEEGERPEWILERARYLDQWRSQKHLVWLLNEWRKNRFEKDAALFGAIEKWAKKDCHLWLWESNNRTQALRSRLDFYRVTAARWATRYARILVTDMDLRDFAELPAPEDAADTKDIVQRRSRTLAAPSELCGAIKNACSTHGSLFEEVKGAWKTQTCNACGKVFAFAARQDIVHKCECGVEWDQDANHCKNLLASGGMVNDGQIPLASSESRDIDKKTKEGGRWKKRRSQDGSQATAGIDKL